jgi:hypothetical protein
MPDVSSIGELVFGTNDYAILKKQIKKASKSAFKIVVETWKPANKFMKWLF